MPPDPIYTLLYNTAADKSSVFYCPFEIFPCVVKRYDPFSLKKEENEWYNVFVRLETSLKRSEGLMKTVGSRRRIFSR